MTIALIVIIALVVLAAITIGATLRGRDADSATGRLARETLSRDRVEEMLQGGKIEDAKSLASLLLWSRR